MILWIGGDAERPRHHSFVCVHIQANNIALGECSQWDACINLGCVILRHLALVVKKAQSMLVLAIRQYQHRVAHHAQRLPSLVVITLSRLHVNTHVDVFSIGAQPDTLKSHRVRDDSVATLRRHSQHKDLSGCDATDFDTCSVLTTVIHQSTIDGIGGACPRTIMSG